MTSPLRAVVSGLHFTEDRSDSITRIETKEWPNLLSLTDQAQLTLPLAIRRLDCLPPTVQTRVNRNLARNAERALRIRREYSAIERELERRGVEFIVLKGMTHWPLYCDDLAHRAQFDLDLYCPEPSMRLAAEAFRAMSYEPARPARGSATDHLPPLIRKTGWRWQGDYYDPDMPLTVELHFRFWNPLREAFAVVGADGFMQRRITRVIGGFKIPALDPPDDLAYTTWHLVRHLLHGNLRLYHVYELAHFLHRTANANSFWKDWKAAARGPRVAEPIAFRLACEWFGCQAHPAVREEIERLPKGVDRWFRLFAFSPVLAMERPNKDELFLHLTLARKAGDRIRIAAHKLVPLNPPRVLVDAHVIQRGVAMRIRSLASQASFLAGRALRHIHLWVPILRSAFRWRAAS